MNPDFRKMLSSTPKAGQKWGELTPIARRDFTKWVESAKQLETRKRRMKRTCELLISGKRRPCCYSAVPMDLYTALNQNPKAREKWRLLTPDQRRDFASWVDESASNRKVRSTEVCKMLVKGRNKP